MESRNRSGSGGEGIGNPAQLVRTGAASLLLTLQASVRMVRAAAVALALTLLGGANTALLCQVWCQPVAAAAAGCHEHHQGSSARLTGENCEDLVAATAVLTGESGRKSLNAAPLAPAAAAFFFVRSTARASSAYGPHAGSPLQQRPLETALRI